MQLRMLLTADKKQTTIHRLTRFRRRVFLYPSFKRYYFMTTTKKSLLHHVRDIEMEAAKMVADAKENGMKEMNVLQGNTKESLDSIRQKAQKTSSAIIQEHKQRAQVESQQILEQSKGIASKIHETAEKNQRATLEKAKSFFNEEFGTNI